MSNSTSFRKYILCLKIIGKTAIKSFNKRILLALLITLLLQIADYFASNISYPLLDSTDSLMWFDFLTKRGVNPSDTNVMYVNMGLDKTLAPIIDEFGDTIGNVAISDRKKLATFLDMIKDARYKYVFLDIRFEKGIVTQDDSCLFSVIAGMKNLVYSTHRDMEDSTPEILWKNRGFSDYRGNFKDGFTRYEYLQDGEPSAPLKIFTSIKGTELIEKNGLYFQDGDLAFNMKFIPFYKNDAEEFGDKGLVKYPYLGSQIFSQFNPEEIKKMAEGKLVVIGDFINDMHQTYMGEVPGPVIGVRAYQSIEQDGLKFSWLCFSITSVIYFFILYNLLGKNDINDLICSALRIKKPIVKYIVSLLGWGFILSAVKIILYLWLHISFIVLLPTLVFSTISLINDIHTQRSYSLIVKIKHGPNTTICEIERK